MLVILFLSSKQISLPCEILEGNGTVCVRAHTHTHTVTFEWFIICRYIDPAASALTGVIHLSWFIFISLYNYIFTQIVMSILQVNHCRTLTEDVRLYGLLMND